MIKKFSVHVSRLSAAALFAMLLFFSPTVEGAIVANGDFEANTDFGIPWATAPLTFWTIGEVLGTGGPQQNMVDGLDPSGQYGLAPHGGNIAAAFNSTTNTVTDGGLATLSQALVTDPAKTYDLSLWVANPIQDPMDFNNIFSVSWNGSLITLAGTSLTEVGSSKTYLVAPNTGWVHVTATNLTVTGTSTALIVSARNSDWATLVDDVNVVETPEPTTLIMLGAGMLLMGLRRYRRARAA